MLNDDKPWMRPMIYTDAQPADTLRGEVPLESDFDPVEHVPRSAGDREASKPLHGSTDKEPLQYTHWSRRLNTVFGVDDEDEPEDNA